MDPPSWPTWVAILLATFLAIGHLILFILYAASFPHSTRRVDRAIACVQKQIHALSTRYKPTSRHAEPENEPYSIRRSRSSPVLGSRVQQSSVLPAKPIGLGITFGAEEEASNDGEGERERWRRGSFDEEALQAWQRRRMHVGRMPLTEPVSRMRFGREHRSQSSEAGGIKEDIRQNGRRWTETALTDGGGQIRANKAFLATFFTGVASWIESIADRVVLSLDRPLPSDNVEGLLLKPRPKGKGRK